MTQQIIISCPRAAFKEHRHIRYWPETHKICMQEVLMVLGKEPSEYMQQCPDEDICKAVGWQLNWTRYKRESLKIHEPKCAVCGLKSPKLQRCSECIKHRVEVLYCSAQCQKEGWATHKKVCMKNALQERISKIENVIAAVWEVKKNGSCSSASLKEAAAA